MGTTVTNKNCIYKEIKFRLNLTNAYYHSVQNFLSSSLLWTWRYKIYRTVLLPVVLCGCETWTLTPMEWHRL